MSEAEVTSIAPSLAEIEAARELVGAVAEVTPMQVSRSIGEILGSPVLLKCENLQRTGAYKIRGAYNRLAKLTPEERAVIETHPRLGYELASAAPSLAEVLPVILHHHERFDGCGYPMGLRDAETPLEARVVAVADVWDALTTDRAYRKGWDAAHALAHIRAGSGTHFDPPIVDAFVALAAEWGVRLPDEPGRAEEAWIAAQTCHEVSKLGELVGVG